MYHQKKGRGKDPSCRRCHHVYETLPHVLCHCLFSMAYDITDRHNGVQNKIVECLEKKKDLEIRVNKRCDPRITGKEDRSRADIVTIDRKENKVCIVDVNCPFDDRLQEGTDRKKEKYGGKADAYRAQGFKVYQGAITIGALGSWCPENDCTLRNLGLSESVIKKMAPYLIGEVIERSKDIFYTHILADRYVPAKNIYNPNPVGIPESQQSTL